MKLLTKEILRKLPPLYSQDGKGDDARAVVKFFHPCGGWTLYVSEFDPVTRRLFGLTHGYGIETEYGYSSLDELEAVRGPMGLGIERDTGYTPKTFREIKQAN